MKTVLAINNQFSSPVNLKYGLTSAVPYYRQVMPGKHLEGFEFHHLGHKMTRLKDTRESEKVIAQYVKDHDIVYTKHLENPSGIYQLLGACDFYNKPLIVDFDDDILSVDGKEHNRYVLPQNHPVRHYVEVLIKEATAITVSTPPLLDVYGELNDNVFLCPNAVDPKDWNVTRRQYDRPTIGWPASSSHIVDHPVFEPVMKELIKRHPDVVFALLGHYLPEHLDWLPRKNWELKPGISWWEGNPEDGRTYPKILADLGADIGVAPLIDSKYNAARSLVKWFEYTMTGTPLVASEYGPYTALVDNEHALLVNSVDGWVAALDYLLTNPYERQRLVINSAHRITSEFTITHQLPRWREVFSAFSGFRTRA